MAKIYKTAEEIQAAIAAREMRLANEARKGSTGVYGKRFESDQRLTYKLDNGLNVYRDDFKAKDPRQVDMLVFVHGRKRHVELKTGRGALVYCDDEIQAWHELSKKLNSSVIFVWDAFKDGEPLCFILGELLQKLSEYKGKGLSGWFEYVQPTDYRSGQLQFKPYMNSKAKLKFLQEVAYEIGLDWETIRTTGELG